MARFLFVNRDARRPALLGAGLLFLAGPLLAQASRPSQAPPPAKVTPFQKLLAELKALPPPPGGRRERVKVLRKWFVPRDLARHRALQQLLLQGKDRESRLVLLGFLKDDLPVLLADGRRGTREGKIFLGYVDPLIGLAGGKDPKLAAQAVQILLSLPFQARRGRFQELLGNKGNPLFHQALRAAGSMQDLSLAPLVARWLGDKEAGGEARDSLRALTFREFQDPADFQAWWKKAKAQSWEELRDLYLRACLDRERTFLREKEAFARKARAQVEKELLPLVKELVATRVRAHSWKEPLVLLKKPLTRKTALAGIVEALDADPGLMVLPQGEEGMAFRGVFDLLLEWADKDVSGLGDLLLSALSHLSNLPAREKDLRSRALACLQAKALAGPVERRLAALPLLASFTGKDADRVLLDILSRDSKEPKVLYQVISLLKERELTPDKDLPAALGRAQERLEILLGKDGLPRRVRTDAILFLARWPHSLALPLLEKILLGKGGMGRKLEDRLAAADALLDILQRFRQEETVVRKVEKILVAGLTSRDPKQPELSRVRTACAEKLGSDFFLERPERPFLVRGLGEALLTETSPDAVETCITSLLKLGLKAAKVSDAKTLAEVRSWLVKRVQAKPSDPKERDWLFNAILELSDGDPAAKLQAAYAFGRAGDRTHALPFFAELTSKLPLPASILGPGKVQAARKQASILLDHFALLVTGRLFTPGQGGAPLLENLSFADLELAGSLLEALGRERAKGNLPQWGSRENGWAAEILWRLATAKRKAHEAAAPFFQRAASAIQVLLAQGKVPPKEAPRLSLRLAESLLEGNETKKALIQLWSLVKKPDLEKQVRPLLAKALERTKDWAQAGVQWAEVARTLPKGSKEWWLASLKRVECMAREGKTAEGRKVLAGLLEKGKPGKGPGWEEVGKRLLLLQALLAPRKAPPPASGAKPPAASSGAGPGKGGGKKGNK